MVVLLRKIWIETEFREESKIRIDNCCVCVLVWLSPSSLLEMGEAVGRQPVLQVHLRHRIHHPCLVCLSLLQNCSSLKKIDKKYVLKETFFIACWIFVSLFQISAQLLPTLQIIFSCTHVRSSLSSLSTHGRL